MVRVAPDLQRSVVLSFVQRNQKTESFPSGLTLGEKKVVLYSEAESKQFFGRRDEGWDGWKEFRRVHGNTGIITFSRVGLSHDLTQAMVYMGSQGGWLAGSGRIVILRRHGETWEQLYELPLWVS